MSVIIFLIILAVLILVHEFGHFIVAKKSGIRVDEFGLGFPPKVISKKFGDTLYTLNLIPFGGFVKIFGEDPHNEEIKEGDKHTSFFYKPKWVQASVLIAGVTFNILFAWLLISLGFMIGLPSSVDYKGFGEVRDVKTVITEVMPESPAQKAGLQSGDTILSVSIEKSILQAENVVPEKIQDIIMKSDGKNVEITYQRGKLGENTVLSIKPSLDIETGRNVVGIAMDRVGILKLPIHLALIEGMKTTISLVKSIAIGLGDFLWDIVTLKSDFSKVSGPIGIAGIVGDAQALGFVYLLTLTALISINLAIINLLPFPALDGGRLFFILVEVVIRRPIHPNFVRWANATGFVLLIILMVIITVKDILKLV